MWAKRLQIYGGVLLGQDLSLTISINFLCIGNLWFVYYGQNGPSCFSRLLPCEREKLLLQIAASYFVLCTYNLLHMKLFSIHCALHFDIKVDSSIFIIYSIHHTLNTWSHVSAGKSTLQITSLGKAVILPQVVPKKMDWKCKQDQSDWIASMSLCPHIA